MNINEIKLKAVAMADKVYEILNLVEDGFIKNKMDFLTIALQEEGEVNKMERALTEGIAELSKMVVYRKELASLAQIVEMLERMGDEATGLIERIEMKVHEKLLFAEEAVTQFNEHSLGGRNLVVNEARPKPERSGGFGGGGGSRRRSEPRW